MTRNQRWRLFIDVQFMQTGAFYRGMGQHVRGLIKAALPQLPKEVESVHFIYSNQLPTEHIEFFQNELHSVASSTQLVFDGLDLTIHDLAKPGDYGRGLAYNQTVVDAYYADYRSGSDYWFVPCLMQEPVIPTMPEDPLLRTGVLWYDLMPYLMHDHYFPDHTTPHAYSYLSRINQLVGCDQILTISEASKRDLVRYLSLDPKDIANTQGWVNTDIQGQSKGVLPPKIKAPFFLLNASPEPNKNALRAIKAFGIFNSRHGNKYQLVITSDYDQKLASHASDYAKHVHFVGHVSSEEMRALYDEAEALFFPSLYEGLGLPPLEAISFNKKVVCADIPVLHESGAGDAFYWCDPYSPEDMARALEESSKTKDLSQEQRKAYEAITERRSWEASAKLAIDAITAAKKAPRSDRRIAVVGPHPSSFSSIGKFIVEAYPYLSRHAQVDYYYDQGPSDQRHGHVKFCYLQVSPHLRPISELMQSLDTYDKVVYHMGNSDHHMVTYLLAHSHPDTLVLHDTNLGGDGLSGQMLSNGFLSRARLDMESRLEVEYLGQPERFIASLVSTQKQVVAHSEFAMNIVRDYNLKPKQAKPVRLQHPMQTLDYGEEAKQFADRPLRLGIAGIVTDVKGVNSIEWLMERTRNLEGAELYIFGFGFFADKAVLRRLEERYPNVHVAFDLTDLAFNDLLASLDILINYRGVYKGEASRATLEAMRERVVPVVRKIGWFDELPDEAAFKITSIEEMPVLIRTLLDSPDRGQKAIQDKITAGQQLLAQEFGFDVYQKVIMGQ